MRIHMNRGRELPWVETENSTIEIFTSDLSDFNISTLK
jgi:hypothetical protein